jgi:hypothetical protein
MSAHANEWTSRYSRHAGRLVHFHARIKQVIIICTNRRGVQAGTRRLDIERLTMPLCDKTTKVQRMLTLAKFMLGTIEKAGNLFAPPDVIKEEKLFESIQPPTSSLRVATDDLPKPKSLETPDSSALSDLDRALVEAAEEMSFAWPEFLPVERIEPGLIEIALWCLLFVSVVALGVLLFFAFAS